jgi:hypothetical protein
MINLFSILNIFQFYTPNKKYSNYILSCNELNTVVFKTSSFICAVEKSSKPTTLWTKNFVGETIVNS